MLYNTLKIVHIIVATLFLTSLVYSVALSQCTRKITSISEIKHSLSVITGLIIIPLAMTQLITGFSMMSLSHKEISSLWVKGSSIGFVIMLSCWIAFIYVWMSSTHPMARPTRVLAFLLITCCFLALLIMIFFMTNQIITFRGSL